MRDTTGLRELVEQHKRQTGEKLTGQAPIKLREGVKLARALGVTPEELAELCGEA